MNKKRISIISLIALASVGVLYAADTIIVNISGNQSATTPGSNGESIRTIWDGDLKLINKNNDENSVDDYFSGYYFDPVYGFFEMDTSGNNSNVKISSDSYSSCNTGYSGYKLSWYSYNPDFGFMNFNQNSSNFVYICIPDNGNDNSLSAYLGGYAFSPYIGFQSFDGLVLDASVDREGEHDSEGRYLKVEGVVSSSNYEAVDTDFENDVRVLWKITKSTLRKNIQQKVYSLIRNVSPNNGSYMLSGLASDTWSSSGDGVLLQGGKILYFWDMSGQNVVVAWSDAITGNKTLVVEGGNIYITGNVRGTGMLGLIAIEKDGNGGNIYIDPSVTDIHAVMYADKSLVSYDGSNELDGNTQAEELAKQLYIYGSVFSENTIGWGETGACPYYINSCSDVLAKKYDLNYLRRYILVQPVDSDGNPVGDKRPQYEPDGVSYESFMWDNSTSDTDIDSPGYRKFPVIIEYNSSIQQTPPPLF